MSRLLRKPNEYEVYEVQEKALSDQMTACPFISNSERDFFPGSSSTFKQMLPEPSSTGTSCMFNQLFSAWWELIWTI